MLDFSETYFYDTRWSVRIKIPAPSLLGATESSVTCRIFAVLIIALWRYYLVACWRLEEWSVSRRQTILSRNGGTRQTREYVGCNRLVCALSDARRFTSEPPRSPRYIIIVYPNNSYSSFPKRCNTMIGNLFRNRQFGHPTESSSPYHIYAFVDYLFSEKRSDQIGRSLDVTCQRYEIQALKEALPKKFGENQSNLESIPSNKRILYSLRKQDELVSQKRRFM